MPIIIDILIGILVISTCIFTLVFLTIARSHKSPEQIAREDDEQMKALKELHEYKK